MRARRGQLLHAGRQVRGLAHGRVVHVQVVANGPHHHLAGVEADADLHGHAMGAAHLLGIAAHRGLHGQGRIAGPHGMVFMRKRRPKQGHDAIAHDLVHRAFVAVHGLHHALQHGIEELPGLLRVAVGQEFHRAFEVGKQHRDLLALAFQGAAGGEDFLGEIRRRVGERDVLGWRCGGACSGGSARPDQHLAVLIQRHLLDLNEFHLQVFEVVVIQGELALQGPVGEALVLLQPVDDLC